MALTSEGLSALVSVDHLSIFPTAATSTRANPATGVLPHNPALAFIDALCDGVVTAAKTLPILDIGSGTQDVSGVAPPVPVTFPAIPAAQAYLIARAGWVGVSSALASQIFIGSVLLNVSKLSLLQMPPNALLGTGTGIVSPASNPALEAAALLALQTALPVSFQASGKFGTGDIPGSPPNPQILIQITAIAEALAKGLASITATVPYVGTATVTTPVSGIVNTGALV